MQPNIIQDEEFEDEDSISVDLKDVVHDDLIGDLLIRFLSSPLIDDPYWVKNDASRNLSPPAYLDFTITYDEIVHLCAMASASFLDQPALIHIEKEELPLCIVADLHGCLTQVLRVFKCCGPPHKKTFLFLGDYVDRGVQGVELMTLLFCLKIRYPTQLIFQAWFRYFFIIFSVWRMFLGAFNCMPVAAIVAGTIFCAHGGISPFINCLDDINKIKRPSIVPAYGIGCDLLWSDPSVQGDGWILSHRGISFLFGSKAVEDFCIKHNVDIILRGHQINNEMYKNGYRISFDGRLVTLFSAPNYMNYKNNSCVVTVSSRVIKF
ncbi:Ser/Thr phosphatase family protein [Dictyocaulus viviparus]|uniref:Ser/Thr phosphatase family protein n=1 Tax=Dictyocaulus viviparus TaxID=29172 RepID=A0A0D8XVZ1_DICVI|nr:Ser/Thr phosphatase family protein [Dictyocaulus viviparus]